MCMSGRTTGILSTGKVKHRNTRYLGIEVTTNGEKQIIPPKKRFKEFEITKSVRYGDIAVLYDLFTQYGLIELLNGLIPRRGLQVGEVFASYHTNAIFLPQFGHFDAYLFTLQ